MTRPLKQFAYAVFYLAVAAFVVFGGYDLLTPDASCFDGLMNGGEEGVDCGALACGMLCPPPVLSLRIDSTTVISAGDGYDAIVTMTNPNPTYGAARVDVSLLVTKADGTTSTVRDVTYLNPLQMQYLVYPLRGVTERPASVSLQFDATRVQWAETRLEGASAVSLGVRNERLAVASESVSYEASVANRSAFDLNEIDIVVLLMDSSGAVVGANPTTMRTLKSGEQRDFSVVWPFAVTGAVRAEAFATTNLLTNENFIRLYDPAGLQEF